MLPSHYTCRSCKCHALCRLRRRGIDHLFSAVGLSPVRCLTCGSKSYMRLAEKDRTSKPRRRVALTPAPAHSVSAPSASRTPRRAA